MTPDELNSAVIAAVRDAVTDGELAVPVPEKVHLTTTTTGRYATPLALRLARAAGRPAIEVAALLAERLARDPDVTKATVTGAGFITIEVPPTIMIDDDYGLADVPRATWPEWPRRFGNPGFEVRFAYARAAGVGRHAVDLGIGGREGPLDDPRERRLLGLVAEFPGRAEQAQRRQDPRPFTRHLELTAGMYHDVHEHCPALPKGDEPVTARHAARVGLARAVRVVVGNGLRMLGETPNDRL